MSRTIEFSEEQRQVGKALRRLGKTWEQVGLALGVSKGTARKNVEGPPPSRQIPTNTLPRGMRRAQLNLGEVNRPEVPPQLLIEREQRMLTPRDLTSQFFGDPPRGWSALDRRR